MITRPPPRPRGVWIDEFDRHAIGDETRSDVRKERDDFSPQCRGDHLVGIKVQHPVITALIFRKTLLSAEAQPSLSDHAAPFGCRYADRVVSAFAVDDDNLIDPRANGSDGTGDAISLHFLR